MSTTTHVEPFSKLSFDFRHAYNFRADTTSNPLAGKGLHTLSNGSAGLKRPPVSGVHAWHAAATGSNPPEESTLRGMRVNNVEAGCTDQTRKYTNGFAVLHRCQWMSQIRDLGHYNTERTKGFRDRADNTRYNLHGVPGALLLDNKFLHHALGATHVELGDHMKDAQRMLGHWCSTIGP